MPFNYTFWPTNENCLNLNIWTQSISKSAKKPVMVWLHGGGYMKSSAIEHQSYEGMNLSEYGDVVVVSINHRLNVLGYLSLDDYGEKYKNSGNLGQFDIVEALKWINHNIENFGGDKDNVTIFGQSGGGMKVAALMQTPAADGLYHKAIIESGVAEDFTPTLKEERKEIVQYMLKEIGIKEENVSELETVDYPILAKAFYNATESIIKRVGGLKQGAPCQNDYYLGDGRFVGFREESNNIPVMVGSCFGEFNFEESFDRLTISEDELNIKLEKYFGQRY